MQAFSHPQINLFIPSSNIWAEILHISVSWLYQLLYWCKKNQENLPAFSIVKTVTEELGPY